MQMTKPTPDLGAQDPELKNSPVAWESDDDTETLRESIYDDAVCYFNDDSFGHGATIRSGTTLLRCDFGVWVPLSSTDAR